ncbi:MAG: tetratricopeptide repeat protein [Blastocatellia bacterium]|nr:tetratricopeptide repeat protein [Blastocatellia bacterium]
MPKRYQPQLAVFCLIGMVLAFNSCSRPHVTKTVPAPPVQKPAPPEAAPPDLSLGKSITHELKSGENHSYRLALKAQDYLSLAVVQTNIAVVVKLVGPDEKQLAEINVDFEQVPESLDFVAQAAGTYQLLVAPGNNVIQTGRYEIKVDALRPATVEDQTKAEVNQLLDEAAKLQQAGQYQKALPVNEKAVKLAEQNLGAEHPTRVDADTGLAMSFYYLGKHDQAEQLFVRALAMVEKTQGPDSHKIASLLNSLALVYYGKGDFGRAESRWVRARAIYEKALGPEHLLTAHVLSSLAELYRVTGDYARAEPLFIKALGIREKWLGPEHMEVAKLLGNLARLYDAKADYVRAEPIHQRVLSIFEKSLGPEHTYTGIAVGNLANFYNSQGDFQRAGPLYERQLSIFEKALGPEHSYTATALHNLAHLYRSQNDYVRAEPLFARGLAIYEKTLGPEHPYTATSLSYLAYVYRKQNDYARAEPHYLRALAIQEKMLGSEHPDTARTLLSLAALYYEKGEYAKAVTFQIKGNDTRERELVRNLASGSEEQKLLYLKKNAEELDRTLSLQVQGAPDDTAARRMALEVILRRKGRALDAMTNAIAVLRSRKEPETQKLLDDHAGINAKLSNLILKGPGQKKPEEHQAQIRDLESQKNQLENTISARSAEFRVQTAPIALDGIQKAIPPNAALVEYAAFRPLEVKTGKFGKPHYIVFVLKPGLGEKEKGKRKKEKGITKDSQDSQDSQDSHLLWADLGEAEPIEQAVAGLRTVLRDRKSDFRLSVKAKARAVDQLVMQPVRKLLGSTQRLLLSPDGVLNLIPFDALIDEQGRFLVQRYEISYLTSGRDLLRLQNGIQSQTKPAVLGDPDYGGGLGPQVFGQSLKPLVRLPGTSQEALFIQSAFPQAEVELKSEATEQKLKSIHRPLLLHIATHGCFLQDAGLGPQGAKGRNLELVEEKNSLDPKSLKTANPLTKSMLFFAGANLGKSGEDDGVLTALEAAGLDLWGTKLVVLSACDTGLGEVQNGEGVYGMRRALVLAGSETQMMSLWPVSDQATRDLMVEYYRRLKAGEGRSTALRRIRLEFLTHPKRKHPYYWAGFIQSGEWGNLDGKR